MANALNQKLTVHCWSADQRVSGWPLADWRTALSLTCLCAWPLALQLPQQLLCNAVCQDKEVLWCADMVGVQAGLRYMRDRKPVNVTAFAQAHNLFMTVLSLWMAVETVVQACTPCRTRKCDRQKAVVMKNACCSPRT